MADDSSTDGTTWPMPKFRFEVDLGADLKGIAFQEVSGIEVENQIIEYRKGDSKIFSTEKAPEAVRYGDVTLKSGVMIKDSAFLDWYTQVLCNTIQRSTVIIRLLNEAGDLSMKWELQDAWPTKIESTDLKSDAGEVDIDTLEIAYERLKVSRGK